MHKLQNGSQVSVRPPRKPLVGTAGYLSESNEQGAPSIPGQDWFNDCIDEFINALNEMGITYDQEQLDHLARAFAAVRSQEWNALVNYGVGEQVLFLANDITQFKLRVRIMVESNNQTHLLSNTGLKSLLLGHVLLNS